MDPATWPFIGRGTEVQGLAGRLVGGTGVVLVGQAGVGKTQLARAVVAALGEGVDVRWTTASVGTTLAVFSSLGDVTPPPVVVVDDVHLLDDDQAALVASLVVARRIVLLATMRKGERPSAPITTLWKDDYVHRHDVAPLSRHDVDDLLSAALPGPIDVAARRRFWELTEGWPLFLRELVRSSLEHDVLVRDGGGWRLQGEPHAGRLDELLEVRFAALDDAARHVVELVALGSPLPLQPLLASAPPTAVEAAERSGLVVSVRNGTRADVEIGHPVFAEVVVRQLTSVRSAALHQRLLELLEQTPMRRADDVVRAATWQLRAGGSAVTDDMVLAARRALYARNEWLAVELATRAVADQLPNAEVVLSEALTDLGEHERARHALDDVRRRPDDAERSLLASRRAITLYWGFGDADAAERLLTDATASLPEGVWRRKVRSEHAVLVATRGDLARAAELSDDLLDDSAPAVFVSAATAGSIVRMLDGRAEDAADLAARGFEMGFPVAADPYVSDPSIHLVAQAFAWSEAGRLAEAEQLARDAHEMSAADGVRTGQAWFALVLGRTLLLRGRPTAALAAFEEAAVAFGWLRHLGPRRWSLAGSVLAAALVGDSSRAEAAWAAFEETPEHPAAMLELEVGRAEAWRREMRGDRRGALDALRRLAEIGRLQGHHSVNGGVVHDIVRLGGHVAEHEIEAIERCQGALAPLRARYLRAAMQRDAPALDAAGHAFEQLGAEMFACEAFHRAASEYDRSGLVADAVRCRNAASAALAVGGELEPITVRDDEGSSQDLTEREREITDLVRAGCSNREIADTLYLSVRTVENHLYRVYRKLGVSGRRELRQALSAT